MRTALINKIDAFLRFGRVPHTLDNFYANRQAFVKIVNMVSYKFGPAFHELFFGTGDKALRIQKHKNIYNTLIKMDSVMAGLDGSDKEKILSLCDEKLISDADKKILLKLIGEK